MNEICISDFSQLQLFELTASFADTSSLLITAFTEGERGNWLLRVFTSSEVRKVLVLHELPEDAQSEALQSFEIKFGAECVLPQAEAEQALEVRAKEAQLGQEGELSVVIDVSCMSRHQMGYIFAKLKDIAANVLPIRLKIAYCLAKFAPPPKEQHTFNRRVAPVHPAFSGWTTAPHLPIDVMVSLGYEKGKATGAVEYLEPRAKWVFVPNSPEERYLKEVKQHNSDLLISTPEEKIIYYDVLQPLNTYYTLLSLVQGVSNDSRPVLLPFGPKLFFAISLLVAMSVDSASVWHVDSAEELGIDQQPSTNCAIFTCLLAPPVKNGTDLDDFK